MADTDGIDIYAGLSDEEMFDGFGDGTEAQAATPKEETIEETPEEEPAEQIDQSEDEQPADEEVTEEPVAEEQTSDPMFTLKHLGETKDYTRDETITLAQKGLDYDRIRAERDALKAEKASLQEHEDFLKELAELASEDSNQPYSIEDLMVDTKARLIVQREQNMGKEITFNQAKARVREEAKAKKAPTISKREASFIRFNEQYPNVDAESIPKEVWAEFGDGSTVDLSVAYTRYISNAESRKLQEQLNELQEKFKTLEQNQKNKQRSTGSRRSNGSPPIDHDLDGWGEY